MVASFQQQQQGEGSPTAGAGAARETELLSTIAELRAEAVQIRTANAERDEELVRPDDSFISKIHSCPKTWHSNDSIRSLCF